jgi:hypothetical protein
MGLIFKKDPKYQKTHRVFFSASETPKLPNTLDYEGIMNINQRN